jgi:hypothetical protein
MTKVTKILWWMNAHRRRRRGSGFIGFPSKTDYFIEY